MTIDLNGLALPGIILLAAVQIAGCAGGGTRFDASTPPPLKATSICDAEGAFGFKFGDKPPLLAMPASEFLEWSSEYVLAYRVRAPISDPNFDSYLVRSAPVDPSIFDIIGLKEIPMINSKEEFEATAWPVMQRFIDQLSQARNIEFTAPAMPRYQSAKDELHEYQVSLLYTSTTNFIGVSCIDRKRQRAMEWKVWDVMMK